MKKQPNILLIMTDQQRADSLGYSGCATSDTPILDAYATQGVIFENAYSSSTACVPARVSLLTGLLPNRVPTVPNYYALQEGFWTIAHAFKRVDYDTALFGKLHMMPMRANHGFSTLHLCEHLNAGYGLEKTDDYGAWLKNAGKDDSRFIRPAQPKVFPYAAEYHPTHWITERSLDFLKSRNSSRPYFAVVSYAHPHTPYDPPEPYASKFRPEDQIIPKTGIDINRDLPKPFLDAVYDANEDGFFMPVRTDKKPEQHVRSVLAAIRALNKQIDDAVGKLLNHVDLSNTVVFFTSDHGDFGAQRGFLGKIPWIPFDDLAKVPFFIFGAGIPGGHRVKIPVQNFDYVPTALELAGLTSPYAGLDSFSLVSALRERKEPIARPIFCETKMGWPMVRQGSLKHIWHDHTDSDVLYDMEKDPAESNNIASDLAYAELLKENKKLIRAILSAPIL